MLKGAESGAIDSGGIELALEGVPISRGPCLALPGTGTTAAPGGPMIMSGVTPFPGNGRLFTFDLPYALIDSSPATLSPRCRSGLGLVS